MASFMEMALDEAAPRPSAARCRSAAWFVRDGAVVARAGNRTLADKDPTAHAELLAIRAAAAGARHGTPC